MVGSRVGQGREASSLTNDQVQRTKVATSTGYAKDGSGDVGGVCCPPAMICTAATAKRGNYARAARCVEEALEPSRQTCDRLATYTSPPILAQAAQGWGEQELAARSFGEALRITHALGDRAASAHCLQGLARVAGARGEAWHAARLLGAAEALLEAVVPPRWAFLPDRLPHECRECAPREQFGEEAFESARSEGGAMQVEPVRSTGYGVPSYCPALVRVGVTRPRGRPCGLQSGAGHRRGARERR
jgi:hypothetical protein